MGPNWGRQDPGGTHVGPMNFAIREYLSLLQFITRDGNNMVEYACLSYYVSLGVACPSTAFRVTIMSIKRDSSIVEGTSK